MRLVQHASKHNRKTHRSFQKTLSSLSSLVSSSVTPPNMTPTPFAAHKAIVHPLRRQGAYASEGRLRLSHLKVVAVERGFFEDENKFFPFIDEDEAVGVEGAGSVGNVILHLRVEYMDGLRSMGYKGYLRNQVSSKQTPTGRFPFAYSLQ